MAFLSKNSILNWSAVSATCRFSFSDTDSSSNTLRYLCFTFNVCCVLALAKRALMCDRLLAKARHEAIIVSIWAHTDLNLNDSTFYLISFF